MGALKGLEVVLCVALGVNTCAGFAVVPLHGDVDRLGYVYAQGNFFKDAAEVAAPDFHPGSAFRLIVDSSSRLTWAPCTGCDEEDCGEKHSSRLINRQHQTQSLLCYDQTCPKLARNCVRIQEGKTDDCVMDEDFTDGEWLEGLYVITHLNLSSAFQAKTTFGCVQDMSPAFQDQYADGSLGLSESSEILGVKDGQTDGWSICIASGGFYGGTLEIGANLDLENRPGPWIRLMEETSLYIKQWRGWYGTQMHSPQMKVDSQEIEVDYRVNAFLNTGSPMTWLPEDFFESVRQQVLSFCDRGVRRCAGNKRVTGDDQSVACFDVRSTEVYKTNSSLFVEPYGPNKHTVYSIFETFPNISFAFDAEDSLGVRMVQYLDVQPKEYMYYKGDGVYCIGMVIDRRQIKSPPIKDITIGVNALRGWNLTVDLRNSQSSQSKKFSLNPCVTKYDIAISPTEIEDKSIVARATVSGFSASFILTLALLCCCRCYIMRTSVRYEPLKEFGTGDTTRQASRESLDRFTTSRSAGKFSIGSEEEEDSFDSDVELGALGDEVASSDEDNFFEQPKIVHPKKKSNDSAQNRDFFDSDSDE